MRGFFRMEGPVFEGLSRLADLVILNLIFIVCCIPVITIGPALTAMNYVMLKMKEKTEGYIVRSFFRSFKQNFRQAVVIWLIMLVAAAVLYVDFRMLPMFSGFAGTLMRVMVFMGALIWAVLLIYAFALLARFENTIRQTFINALLLALAHLPRTLLMLAIPAGAVFLTFYNSMTLAYGLLVWLLVGFSLLIWINAAILAPVFRKLMGERDFEKEIV